MLCCIHLHCPIFENSWKKILVYKNILTLNLAISDSFFQSDFWHFQTQWKLFFEQFFGILNVYTFIFNENFSGNWSWPLNFHTAEIVRDFFLTAWIFFKNCWPTDHPDFCLVKATQQIFLPYFNLLFNMHPNANKIIVLLIILYIILDLGTLYLTKAWKDSVIDTPIMYTNLKYSTKR